MRSGPKTYDYWQERARNLVHYKGETFYTVTSLPFYIKRREEMLDLFKRELEQFLLIKTQPDILDFGCGDGKTSILMKQLYPECKVYGCDLSTNMIQQARLNAKRGNTEIQFEAADSMIPFDKVFDLIFINAVLAHINTPLLDDIVRDMVNHLSEGGEIVIFEQTASTPRQGETWYRRTERFYEDLFERNGLGLAQKELISHFYYDKVDRLLRRYLFRHRANPNKAHTYIWVCEILMKITYSYDKRQSYVPEGNTFFVFKKGIERTGI